MPVKTKLQCKTTIFHTYRTEPSTLSLLSCNRTSAHRHHTISKRKVTVLLPTRTAASIARTLHFTSVWHGTRFIQPHITKTDIHYLHGD